VSLFKNVIIANSGGLDRCFRGFGFRNVISNHLVNQNNQYEDDYINVFFLAEKVCLIHTSSDQFDSYILRTNHAPYLDKGDKMNSA